MSPRTTFHSCGSSSSLPAGGAGPPGDPRVILRRDLEAAGRDPHRSQLEQNEAPAEAADPLLPEKDRPARGQDDHDCRERKNRQGSQQDGGREHELDAPGNAARDGVRGSGAQRGARICAVSGFECLLHNSSTVSMT
jgi:hypothetical protein